MKKLTTILALTAVTANLGIATVFAQPQDEAISGTQSIDCDNTGDITLVVDGNKDITFYPRTVNFKDATQAYASASKNANKYIKIQDTRGYDSTCGFGATLSIQSSGLNHPDSGDIIDLMTGDYTRSNFVIESGSIPDSTNFYNDIVGNVKAGTETDIKNSVQIFETNQAFSGSIKIIYNPSTDDGSDYDDVLVAAKRPSSVIAQGTYTGTITFSLEKKNS